VPLGAVPINAAPNVNTRQCDGRIASGDGRESFLPPLADQQGQGGGGQSPRPETTLTILREGQTIAAADQLPEFIRDAGQEHATTTREAGGGLIFDELGSAVVIDYQPPFVRVFVLLAQRFGTGGLPQVKDRDRDTWQGVAQGAPAAVLKVPVAAVKVGQARGEVARLGLGMAAPGSAFGLDLVPLVTRQLFPFLLPVALRARPEGGHVEGGHFRGNA
jgi:hypothetical protein